MKGFVAYRLPETKDVISYSGSWSRVTHFNEKDGFCLKTFEEQSIWVLQKEQDGWYDITDEKERQPSTEKTAYIEMIQKAIDSILENELEKVVLSRVMTIEGKINIRNTFAHLVEKYPNSFCSVFFHPEFGLWMGATPETLVKINENKGETMALAGTQPNIEDQEIQWTSKEIDEQAFVRKEIEQILKSQSIQDYTIGKKEDLRAGKVSHILNRISFSIDTEQILPLIKALHPTSAVSGIPRSKAIEKIRDLEVHQRSCYTGFLGPIEDNNAQLFVNLRCMSIHQNSVQLYLGGGITKDSVPEKEWVETELKSTTLKNCLSFE